MTENFFVRFDNLLRRFWRIDIFRFQANQLFFAFARQQFHRTVTTRKLFVLIAIENQVRGSIKERA